MVAGAAFADPEADFNLAEVSGNAAVTWGVDLDEGTTGFKNSTDATVKLNLVNSGTKSTEGEGIWAELGVKYDGSLQVKSNTDPVFDGGVASIDAAKLHFYNFYVGIKSGDTLVGYLELPNAVQSAWNALGNVQDTTSKTQGIVLGYGDNGNMSFELDFRSLPAGSDYYTNDYGLAAEFKLLDSNEFLPGLFVTLGGDFQFNEKALGAAASAGYKLSLGDVYYVKPVVGWTMGIPSLDDASVNDMALAAGLVFAWGDEADANVGVPYLDVDNANKVIPGIGIDFYMPLADGASITLIPSFYTGDIVENLTAGAVAQIEVNDDPKIAVAGGLKYAIAATDSVTVTPYAGARWANKGVAAGGKDVWTNANTDNGNRSDLVDVGDGLLNIKGGFDIAGLINNTTFSVWYQSRNLLNDDGAELGTINVQCKISF